MSDMKAMADLLMKHHAQLSKLTAFAQFGDTPEIRKKASDTIAVNAAVMGTYANFLAEPPSFSWFLVETTLENCDNAIRWSIHT